jgi:hypothetical protein
VEQQDGRTAELLPVQELSRYHERFPASAHCRELARA